MDDRRTGSIVAAVTLTISVAFLIIAVLFLNTSVSVAARYAESSTDLHVWELQSQLDDFVNRQYALVASSLFDDQLCHTLVREANGVSKEDTARELTAVLDKLVVDEEVSSAFVASTATSELYLSGGEHMHVDLDESLMTSVEYSGQEGSEQEGQASEEARGATELFRLSLPYGKGDEGQVLIGRLLYMDGHLLGVVGTSVQAHGLARVLEGVHEEYGEDAVCFLKDGTILFSSDDEAHASKNAFTLFAQVDGLQAYVENSDGDASDTLRVWAGLEGPMPRGQVLYEVQYCESMCGYVLVANPAENIFSTMRTRVTTLVLALCVVMVLLLLLVMYIVRWYRARLIKVATTDELTGLANRKSFSSSYVALAERGDLAEATMLLIDVDKFKQVNDSYGHAVGDLALASVASHIKSMVKGRGLAGRWGGDEFIAVLLTDHDQAVELARNMVDEVAACDIGDGVHVSVSVGTAAIRPEHSLEVAVERADDALYVTKEGGRGFVTDYVEGTTPHVAGTDSTVAGQVRPKEAKELQEVASGEEPQDESIKRRNRLRQSARNILDVLVKSLLEAVHKMVPFVAGGGILIAIAFLVDGASVDINSLTPEVRASFGSITPIANGLHEVGSAAFNFMLPIFAAFFARGLAGDEAFMAGFAGGFLASQGSAGFIGAIAAAVVAAIVVDLMRGFLSETAQILRRVAPVLLYPVFSLLLMYLVMAFVIEPLATAFNVWLTSLLTFLSSGNKVVLGAVSAAMMATDMGGPINKAAYHFGTASIASGDPQIMAAVMVGGMVPPCGIAICMLLFANKFTEGERDQGAATLFMGLSFITEGAIPFVLTDFLRVIPACIAGSAVGGGLSVAYGCTLMAPHGGLFVFPVVENSPMYLLALTAGSLVTALVLGALKKPIEPDPLRA